MAAQNRVAAGAEFQKLIDHPGIVMNQPIGSLAHLELGRAYALPGKNVEARSSYQSFLTPWKDADPNIPILIAAKSEYGKLQWPRTCPVRMELSGLSRSSEHSLCLQ
jgi:eukaryotic-like serine/threonine-protein kinase